MVLALGREGVGGQVPLLEGGQVLGRRAAPVDVQLVEGKVGGLVIGFGVLGLAYP